MSLMASLGFDAQQALLQEGLETVSAQLQLGQQRMRHAVRVLGDGSQRLALAWRSAQSRVLRSCAVGSMPESLLPRLGWLPLAQQDWQ